MGQTGEAIPIGIALLNFDKAIVFHNLYYFSIHIHIQCMYISDIDNFIFILSFLSLILEQIYKFIFFSCLI